MSCVRCWCVETLVALDSLHGLGFVVGDLHPGKILLNADGHVTLAFCSPNGRIFGPIDGDGGDMKYPGGRGGGSKLCFKVAEDKCSGGDEEGKKFAVFVAPEYRNGGPPRVNCPSADFWSFGLILFELLTGQDLSVSFPHGGLSSYSMLNFPATLSIEAKSLISELLRSEPEERLGSGRDGVAEIVAHPFFTS